MLSRKVTTNQIGFYSTFEDQLSRQHPLYILANSINWDQFEASFAPLYCIDNGRRAKPIRLMVSLLILKHIRNLSDESVVEQWAENSYYQYFSGEKVFACGEHPFWQHIFYQLYTLLCLQLINKKMKMGS